MGESLLRSVVLLGLIGVEGIWQSAIQAELPQPYLDEVFHIPQTQAYWNGNWSHWDDKITTPPGVYLFSILVNKVYKFDGSTTDLTTYDLRRSNQFSIYVLFWTLAIWSQVAGKYIPDSGILQREHCMIAFPLLFFFSGLYYTDVFSAATIMVTYCVWEAGSRIESPVRYVFQLIHFISGLISLTARQTNIFWVAVYLGGLQAVMTIKKRAKVHDPPIVDAYFEDFPTTIVSLVTSALSSIPSLLLDLWPHLSLLGVFAAFTVWNGGVVLGDKSNHVATIHLAQMLYIWPFILLFSWPVLLPQLTSLDLSNLRLPRLWVIVIVMISMTAIVHFNTIVHKFLLADNRHYAFYAFKLLRANSWGWYALIPVYAVTAWLSIYALGTRPALGAGKNKSVIHSSKSSIPPKPHEEIIEDNENRITFLIIWLISTALSLITAPLVEPRYFIVPWLMWRLHVPNAIKVIPEIPQEKPNESTTEQIRSILHVIAKRCLWIELAWYMLINLIICHRFLYRGFEWPQEPGQVQRFMW